MSPCPPRWLHLALTVLLMPPVAAQTPPPPVRLTLAGAVARAADSAPAALVAALRADEAAARVGQVRAPLRPALAASAAWLNRTFNPEQIGLAVPAGFPGASGGVIGPFDNWDARLRATQSLFDRAAGLRTGAAREQATSADAERDLARETAAERAAVAYVAVQRAAALVEARAADSALAAELLTLARAQLEAGVSPPIDVVRARAQLVTRAGALVVARSEHARARLGLGRALGLAPTVRVIATDGLSPETAALPLATERAALVDAAGVRRPDLAAELARGRAAERSAAAIRAERWPRVEVAGDVGVNGPGPDAMQVTRQIGIQISVPLVDGFSLESRRAQQVAAGRAAAVRADDLRRTVEAEVDVALLALSAAEAQRGIAAEGVALADEELRQARERFAAGVAGSIELVEAQRSLVAAREAVIEALAAGAAARVSLARAAGVAREIR